MILDALVWCVKSLQVKHNCLLKKTQNMNKNN